MAETGDQVYLGHTDDVNNDDNRWRVGPLGMVERSSGGHNFYIHDGTRNPPQEIVYIGGDIDRWEAVKDGIVIQDKDKIYFCKPNVRKLIYDDEQSGWEASVDGIIVDKFNEFIYVPIEGDQKVIHKMGDEENLVAWRAHHDGGILLDKSEDENEVVLFSPDGTQKSFGGYDESFYSLPGNVLEDKGGGLAVHGQEVGILAGDQYSEVRNAIGLPGFVYEKDSYVFLVVYKG